MTDFVRLREAFSNYLRLTLGKSCEWMVQDWLDIVEITEKEAKV